MACHTTDASVLDVVALAVRQAVRLETNIRDAPRAIDADLLPRSVAAPA